jgi:hypothetical protein
MSNIPNFKLKCTSQNDRNVSNFCMTDLACYRHIDCHNSTNCYGCINDSFQLLQVFEFFLQIESEVSTEAHFSHRLWMVNFDYIMINKSFIHLKVRIK